MAEYVTKAYVDRALGKGLVSGLTGAATSATTHSVVTQLIQSASAMVESALRNAGYTPPGDSAPDMVKTATLGALVPLMYSRKQAPIPDGYELFTDAFDSIRNGDIPVPGLSITAANAVGGSRWTDSSDTTDGRPRIYGSLRKLY
jgi:hypothetical protein